MKHLLLTLALASQALVVCADGTIAFGPGPLMRVRLGSGGFVPTTPGLVVYGVFWGTNAEVPNLALPLGSNSTVTAGAIAAPSVYIIPGTTAGQTVYMQIRGWSAAYGTNWLEARLGFGIFGETDIRQVTLGPEAGPGTVIWQSSAGTDPHRFYPLALDACPLTPPVFVGFGFQPNPSTVVDEGSQGVVDVTVAVIRFANALPSPTNLNFTTTVSLSTMDMTAMAGQDYVATNILVTFGPGETQRHVGIKVIGDELREADEQFGVRLAPLSGCVGAFNYSFVITIREARVSSVRIESNHAVVSFPTTSSQHYALESSPDLISWSVVPGANLISGTGGIVQVIDPSEACCGARFYRTRLLP